MSDASSEELYTGSFLDTDSEHDAAKKTDNHAKGTFTTQKPRKKGDRDRTLHNYTHSPNGLRIEDYMYDDPLAASILTTDSSTNADLLRQLETGC
ncbi:unnamed protein product [Dicrocoelium dendriticum]|nr:unnamed protein product [Dicrocoelium dendriticum]